MALRSLILAVLVIVNWFVSRPGRGIIWMVWYFTETCDAAASIGAGNAVAVTTGLLPHVVTVEPIFGRLRSSPSTIVHAVANPWKCRCSRTVYSTADRVAACREITAYE